MRGIPVAGKQHMIDSVYSLVDEAKRGFEPVGHTCNSKANCLCCHEAIVIVAAHYAATHTGEDFFELSNESLKQLRKYMKNRS